MKSFVSYPLHCQKRLLNEMDNKHQKNNSGASNMPGKKVGTVEGTIVKCGTEAEGFSRIAIFRKLVEAQSNKKVLVFEKVANDSCSHDSKSSFILMQSSGINIDYIVKTLLKGVNEKISFVAGNLNNSIPKYLIDNPELKISFLNIDLNDYEATLTTLQFFYPRLVNGGILIFDNYYKKRGNYNAFNDYFASAGIIINDCSGNNDFVISCVE